MLQGDVFWVYLGTPSGSEPDYSKPGVVIQNNAFDESKISTVVIAAITSNLRLGRAVGNVTLLKGEAGLPKSCVVNISQITTVDKTQLQQKIGQLSKSRFEEVIQGIYTLLKPGLG